MSIAPGVGMEEQLGLLQWQPEYRTDFADYTTERLGCRSSSCATVLCDSVPEAEEQETLTKAAAMLEAIHFTKHKFNSLGNLDLVNHVADCEQESAFY